MKYCKPRNYEATENGIHKTCKYIRLADIIDFHGEEFAKQWQGFAEKKKTLEINGEQVYYYMDYKDCALTTKMYMGNE
jgi:hypothetical protein